METPSLGPLVDTHCHLDVDRMDGVRAAALERAWSAGVTHLVIPGIHPGSFGALANVCGGPSPVRMVPAWGLHPQWLPDNPVDQDAHAFAAVVDQCARHPPVAVGECGLDHRVVDLNVAPPERQATVLRWHLDLARQLHLPVLLHCLSAHDAMLRILDDLPLRDGGIMHSFSGSAEVMRAFVKRGLHISFAGPVSWNGARKAPRAAAECPSELLLAETDAPDQAPTPVRGTLNEPAHLVHVVRALAAARGEDPPVTAALTTRNAHRLLRLPA